MLRLRLVRPLLAIVSSALVAQIVACSDAGEPMAETTRGGPDAQEILARETGTPWHVDRDEAGTSRVLFPIDDTQANPKARDDRGAADVAMQFIERHRALLGIESPSKELELKTVVRGVESTRAVLFRQHARGVPVDGGDVTVHFNADGSLFLVTNDFERGAMAASAKQPRLDVAAAIAAAQADARSRFASLVTGDLAPVSPPQLVIYPTSLDAAALAFEVRLRTGRHVLRHIVDTESGRILLADDGVRHATPKKGDVVEGSGLIYTAVTPTNNYGTEARKLAATVTAVKGVDGATSDEYTLAHAAHPPFAAAAAANCTNPDCSSHVPITSSTPNDWLNGKKFGPTDYTPAITAYVHVQESYTYYRERFQRSSFDGANSALLMFTKFDNNGTDNASFSYNPTGDSFFTFGGSFPQRSLDVVAHEFAHGVTFTTSMLETQGQQGALNEGVSDIFGQFVEHHYNPNGNPDLVGEDDFSPMRNLADPHSSSATLFGGKIYNQPDFVKTDPNWIDPTDLTLDNGGVHTNCSIPTYAWHLMTFGGQHKTNERQVMPADALGWTDSESLWYESTTTLFKPRTNFRQAALRQIGHTRKGRITSAEPKARCEKIKQSDAVACAWYAVGAVDLSETIADAKSDKERAFFCAIMDSCKGPADTLPAVCAQAKPSPKLAECTQADSGTDSGTGSETVSDAGATEADLRDSCVGRADGVYCSQLASFSAIVCKNQQISGGAQCVTSQTCVGPNGPGTTIQCK